MSEECTAWKVSKYGIFLDRIFLYLDWIRRFTEYAFSPNTRKYRPEKASVKENRDERKKWIVKDAVISHLQLLQTGFIRDQHCVKCVRIRSYSDPYSVRKRESSTKHTINIYLFNSNTRKMCEICSKLTIETLKQRQWFWAYFTLFLVFLLLILNK